MKIEDVLQKFNEIFIDVLDEEDIVLKLETTAEDIEDWDSLTHIQIVVAIEKKFDVKFTALEIDKYKNVGEMCQGVLDKRILI